MAQPVRSVMTGGPVRAMRTASVSGVAHPVRDTGVGPVPASSLGDLAVDRDPRSAPAERGDARPGA